jgi:hypothetical protein
VLPGLIEFFLQCLGPEHCITIPLEHIRLLSGSLHDILQKTIIIIQLLKSGRFRLLKGTVSYLHALGRGRLHPPSAMGLHSHSLGASLVDGSGGARGSTDLGVAAVARVADSWLDLFQMAMNVGGVENPKGFGLYL